MPNNCTSSVVILGEAPYVKAVLDIITMTAPVRDSDETETVVTFTKLIPMPEELHGTVSPLEIADTEEEAAAANAKWAEKISNRPWGNAQETRVISRAEYGRRMAAYGAAEWYDWSVKNWGTKWDAYDTEVIDLDESGERLNLRFDTAWSCPKPVFTKLAKDYGVKIFVLWQDEGDDQIVSYKFGKGVQDMDPRDVMYPRTEIEFQ